MTEAMSFTITDKCTGCTACSRRCPVKAIIGERNVVHMIDPRLCIECGACGMICPAEAIKDLNDNFTKRLKIAEIPAAQIDWDLCSGCGFCSDVCPFGCVRMERQNRLSGNFDVAVIDAKKCAGCKVCVSLCIKEAITMGKRV